MLRRYLGEVFYRCWRVRWFRRSALYLLRYNLTFGLVASALVVYGFLFFALSTIYRDIGASDEKLTRDVLRSELYDFLLITGREVDGTSILDNPRDFTLMRRVPSVVELRRSFFSYPLTKANARSFRLANVRVDLPRGCLLEFPLESAADSGPPGVKAVQACFAVVPRDLLGNYIYFALRYPTSAGVAAHQPGRPLSGDGFEFRFSREGRPDKRIRVVYERVSGLPTSRNLPGRYDGVFGLVAFPDEASRPTSLVGGQAIERVEEGGVSTTMTILGRIDGSLLGLPTGAGAQDEFLSMAKTLRLGFSIHRTERAPYVVSAATKGVAKASLEQAYRISVRENALLTITFPRANDPWWSSSSLTPADLREGASSLERFGHGILALMSRDHEQPFVTKDVSIAGKGVAVAKLALVKSRIPEAAPFAIGLLIAALVGLSVMVALLWRSIARLSQLSRKAYAVANIAPETGVKEKFAFRHSQIGTLWRGVKFLLRQEVLRGRELRDEAAKHAKTTERERVALRWIGHQIRNPLQTLTNLDGMPPEATRQMDKLRVALDGLNRFSAIDKDAELVGKQAIPLDIAKALGDYTAANNSPPEDPVQYLGPQVGVWVKFADGGLEQILDTLFENARRHRVPWTPIVVSLQVDEHKEPKAVAIVKVFNQGEPFKDPQRAFERGYTVGDHSGDGLGLYMVQAYCARCNGEVCAENIEGGVEVILSLAVIREGG